MSARKTLAELERIVMGGGSPREAREASGLSLAQAARVTGVDRERIEAIEAGDAVATSAEFAALCAAYDVAGWVRPAKGGAK